MANKLKTDLKDKVALGIIDEDRYKGPSASYFSEFGILRRENNLILKKHSSRKQYLILICPEIEKWLLNNANVVGISPEEFELPKGLTGFKKLTKIQDINKNIGFYRFIKRLINSEAPDITMLKHWILLFKDNQLDTLKED